MIDLAGILYAALTGRWPGVARSGVPRAPREGRRPLRPRQVRAGVPRTLDAICERVLHKEASQHAMPIETAHEIAAALSDYVGDPGLVAPLDLPACTASRPSRCAATRWPQESPTCTPKLLAAEAIEPDEAAEAAGLRGHPAVHPRPRGAGAGSRGHADVPGGPAGPRHDGPDAGAERAGCSPAALRGPPGAAALRQHRAPGLRGSEGGRGSARGRVGPHATAGATATAARGGVDSTSGGTGDTGSGFWPFTDEDEAKNDVHTGKEGRGWMRMAIVVGVLIVVVVAMAIAFNRGRQDGGPTTGSPSTTQSQSAAANAGGRDHLRRRTRLRPRRRPARGEPRHRRSSPSTATPARRGRP